MKVVPAAVMTSKLRVKIKNKKKKKEESKKMMLPFNKFDQQQPDPTPDLNSQSFYCSHIDLSHTILMYQILKTCVSTYQVCKTEEKNISNNHISQMNV